MYMRLCCVCIYVCTYVCAWLRREDSGTHQKEGSGAVGANQSWPVGIQVLCEVLEQLPLL